MRDKENHQKWYQSKRQSKPEGVCSQYPFCKKTTDVAHKLCGDCRAKLKVSRDKSRLRVKSLEECTVPDCRRLAKLGFKLCGQCLEKNRAFAKLPAYKKQGRIRRLDLRSLVISAYGGVCVCCGNADKAFLSIDHINRYDGVGPRGGNDLRLWLKANNFPPGFRVLCVNCNFALGKFGYCPHSDLVQPLPEKHNLTPKTLQGRERQRAYNLELKLAAFNAYGGCQCACCSEPHHECLSIDHINNDGAAHRKELAGKAGAIYLWLARNDYPAGFQVLCMCCNLSKRDNGGTCGHKLQLSGGV